MKTKKILIILGIFLLLVLAIVLVRGNEDSWICKNGEWVRHGNPKSAMPSEKCTAAEEGNNAKTANKDANSFEECVKAGIPIMESYPRKCQVNGKSFTENIGNEIEKRDLILITSPRPNQEIFSPLVITGQARGSWFFEASFPVELYDKDGKLIGSTIAQAKPITKEGWMTKEFVPFEAKLNINYSTSTTGTLILKKDNPSGLPENDDKLIVPVKLTPALARMKIKVFFNNNKLDPETTCTKVFPVEREITRTEATARAAITSLLFGLNSAEAKSGFSTSINPNVKLNSITIEDGVAKADFSKELEAGVGGSCRVAVIRAQITETLKQFSTVKDVVISIDGRAKDILQP
jgi:hypothetical protein